MSKVASCAAVRPLYCRHLWYSLGNLAQCPDQEVSFQRCSDCMDRMQLLERRHTSLVVGAVSSNTISSGGGEHDEFRGC